MTVGNPQTYPKAGDISALNGGVLRRILINQDGLTSVPAVAGNAAVSSQL